MIFDCRVSLERFAKGEFLFGEWAGSESAADPDRIMTTQTLRSGRSSLYL